jgi:PAS domain S-box-containing protein
LDAESHELIERIPAGVVIVREGAVVYANRTAKDWFGVPENESVVGDNVLRFLHPEDHAAAVARLTELDGAAPTDPSREYRGLRADGTVIFLEMASVPIQLESEQAVMLVARDVTAQRRLRAQLVSSDRMASLGMLAAGIAHEINSPLTHVVFNLSCIAKELERGAAGISSEGVARLLALVADAREGASRVTAIGRDLRTFSQGDEDRVVPVDVRHVLESAVNIARLEIGQRARLVREYGETGGVLASESQLAQVFLNLLINAAQSFRVADARVNKVTLRTTQRAKDIVVEVQDTGEGISEDRIGRIFEPFYTTKPVGVGTGLGLWICQSIVSGLGGKIEVDSAPSRGTTVRVSLPAAGGSS